MKRSEINRNIREAEKLFESISFKLPPFASIPAGEWATLGHEYDEIRDRMLGWDLTDFGSGDFEKIGLLLVTLRNGEFGNPESKTYAEKIMVVRENQVTPTHFHWNKMEDIICRGGGNLLVKVNLSNPDESISDADVPLMLDGYHTTVKAGTVLRLTPGHSITMQRGLYHSFWAEEGFGPAIVGEVSMANDDLHDNRFLEGCGRFSPIEEDEAPVYLLCNEYPAAK